MTNPAAQKTSFFAENGEVQTYLNMSATEDAAGAMVSDFRENHLQAPTRDAALQEIVEFCRDQVGPAKSRGNAAEVMRDAFELCAAGSLQPNNPALAAAIDFVDKTIASSLPPISLPASVAWDVGYNEDKKGKVCDVLGVAGLASAFARVTGTTVETPHFTAVPVENGNNPVFMKPDDGDAILFDGDAILYPYAPARALVLTVEGYPVPGEN